LVLRTCQGWLGKGPARPWHLHQGFAIRRTSHKSVGLRLGYESAGRSKRYATGWPDVTGRCIAARRCRGAVARNAGEATNPALGNPVALRHAQRGETAEHFRAHGFQPRQHNRRLPADLLGVDVRQTRQFGVIFGMIQP